MNNDYRVGDKTRGTIIIAKQVNFISRMKNIEDLYDNGTEICYFYAIAIGYTHIPWALYWW